MSKTILTSKDNQRRIEELLELGLQQCFSEEEIADPAKLNGNNSVQKVFDQPIIYSFHPDAQQRMEEIYFKNPVIPTAAVFYPPVGVLSYPNYRYPLAKADNLLHYLTLDLKANSARQLIGITPPKTGIVINKTRDIDQSLLENTKKVGQIKILDKNKYLVKLSNFFKCPEVFYEQLMLDYTTLNVK